MILILEGIDKVGKSTLAMRLVNEAGYKLLRSLPEAYNDKTLTTVINRERIHAQADYLVQVYEGQDWVIDRFHWSQFVYSSARREYVDTSMIDIDRQLMQGLKGEVKIIYISPAGESELTKCETEEGISLQNIYHTYETVYQSACGQHIYTENFIIPALRVPNLKVNFDNVVDVYRSLHNVNPYYSRQCR